jgi:hypothetical protein
MSYTVAKVWIFAHYLEAMGVYEQAAVHKDKKRYSRSGVLDLDAFMR